MTKSPGCDKLLEYAACRGLSLCKTVPKAASKYFRRCPMYAIIATGGKQYKVSEGDVIFVEKLDAEKDSTVTFDQVLAVGGDKLAVGSEVANASVSAKVVDQVRGKKIIVYHYKRKTGYHKKNGHRQAYTKVQIEKINA